MMLSHDPRSSLGNSQNVAGDSGQIKPMSVSLPGSLLTHLPVWAMTHMHFY